MSRSGASLGWVGPATLAISVHVAAAFVPVSFGGHDDSDRAPVELAIQPPPAAEELDDFGPEAPLEPTPSDSPPPDPVKPQPEPQPQPAEFEAPDPAPKLEPNPEPPPRELGLDSDALTAIESPTKLPELSHASDVSPPPAPPAAEVDLSGYRDGLHRALSEEKRYPARARRLGQTGEAKVRITIARDGSLSDEPALVRSTNHAALDEEALRIAEAAAPYAALPADYTAGEAEFLIPVVFDLGR